MSADNFTGVWFNGRVWLIQENMSASEEYDTREKLEAAFHCPRSALSREQALGLAHGVDGESEYGVRELYTPRDPRTTCTGNNPCESCRTQGFHEQCPEMLSPNPRHRCQRPAGHEGSHSTAEGVTREFDPPRVEPKVKRVPVNYLWSKLNWDFLKLLAEIAQYAEEKYGSAEQYMNARLTGEKDPINHAYEHLRKYQAGEPHDKFGDVKYHLAAAAYNIMMAAAAEARWGFVPNPVMAALRKKDP